MTDLLEAIQSSGAQAVMIVSGGGSGALHALLAHPGASRFFLAGRVPYSEQALSAYLGEDPGSACSVETAQKMAEQALQEAEVLAGEEATHALGISCTAALKTVRPRKGADRACLCFCSSQSSLLHQIFLGEESRQKQEEELSRFLLEKLADFLREEIKK